MSAVSHSVGPSAAMGPAGAFSAMHALRAEQVRAFWQSVERLEPGGRIACAPKCDVKRGVILSGWACEMQILPDGRRQIFTFLLPGDPFVVEAPKPDRPSRGVIAITPLQIIDAANPAIEAIRSRESLARAIELAIQQKEARLLDHMVRIGRLSAPERVLHLLLELRDRLEAIGLAKGDTFRLPLTQEVFADALGLSLVHINRTFKQVRRDGYIELKCKTVTLLNRERLRALAFYSPPLTSDAA